MPVWGAEDGLVPAAVGIAAGRAAASRAAPFDEQKDAFLAAFHDFVSRI
jgi:hypothetical protein